MELFTYIQMGGIRDNIEIVPIADDDGGGGEVRRAALQGFSSFRAENATCFKPEDRQHLYAVIEAGFGDFTKFDHCVRMTLVTGMLKRAATFNVKLTEGPASLSKYAEAAAKKSSSRRSSSGWLAKGLSRMSSTASERSVEASVVVGKAVREEKSAEAPEDSKV